MIPEPGDIARTGTLSVRWRSFRLILLAAGAVSLLTGLWSGLARLGLVMPGGIAGPAELHGALMISGFLGTVISLERAVAIGRWWAYLASVSSAAGAVALVAGAPMFAGGAFLLAAAALTVNSVFVVVRQPALFTIVMAVAAACWLGGTVIWLQGAPMAAVSGWWLAFLVLTIAGERLELSRLLSPPRSSQFVFVIAVALVVVGIAREETAANGALFFGIGLLALAIWLLRHDIALRTVRLSGQPRFTAICLIAGYFWLAIDGAWLLAIPYTASIFSYDAVVHAIAVGFVLSMIFGHAPIILPAVLGLRVRYSAMAYVPAGLLHFSVLLRLGADFFERADARVASGLVTIVALAGYAVTLIAVSATKRAT